MAGVYMADTAKIAVEGHDLSSERPIVITFGVRYGSDPDLSMLDDTANVFSSEFCNHPGSYPDTMKWDQVVATSLLSATAPQDTVPADFTGTGGDGYANMSGVFELLTNTRGRSYRGKIHIPIAESDTEIDGGTAASGWLTGFGTILGDVATGLAAMSVPGSLAVISRKLAVSTVVTELLGREVLGFIRRRLDG